MNIELLNQANQNWENFVSSLSDEEKKGLSELNESIAINRLYYLAAINDAKRFDQIINMLSKSFLYDVEIIPTIYKYYVERDLQELAFEYIQNAKDYLLNNSVNIIPLNIKKIYISMPLMKKVWSPIPMAGMSGVKALRLLWMRKGFIRTGFTHRKRQMRRNICSIWGQKPSWWILNALL